MAQITYYSLCYPFKFVCFFSIWKLVLAVVGLRLEFTEFGTSRILCLFSFGVWILATELDFIYPSSSFCLLKVSFPKVQSLKCLRASDAVHTRSQWLCQLALKFEKEQFCFCLHNLYFIYMWIQICSVKLPTQVWVYFWSCLDYLSSAYPTDDIDEVTMFSQPFFMRCNRRQQKYVEVFGYSFCMDNVKWYNVTNVCHSVSLDN